MNGQPRYARPPTEPGMQRRPTCVYGTMPAGALSNSRYSTSKSANKPTVMSKDDGRSFTGAPGDVLGMSGDEWSIRN